MKLQGTYFNIRKISYPNSDTRHGKLKVDLLLQDFANPCTFSIQMVKECCQAMAHEKFLMSHIENYRHWRDMTSAQPNMMVEIFINQKEQEGTGLIYKINAAAFKLGSPNHKYFELSAELSPIK